MVETLTHEQLTRLAEGAGTQDIGEITAMARELLQLRQHLKNPIRLPYCSASPVCEIEAGYAAGVSDCREAIRRAGYLIEGDD